MNVISRKKLQSFWEKHPMAETPLSTWYQIFSKGNWTGPADIKTAFGTNVDFVGDNRVAFDIGGNKYRVVVRVSYLFKSAMIKFVGTHEEYSKINVETV